MHLVDQLAPHLPEPAKQLPLEPGVCAITGTQSLLCVSRSKALGASFTQGGILARPDSRHISYNAYKVLQYRPCRASSWVLDTSGFTLLDRCGVRNRVFAGRPWIAFYVTTSYKKHGALTAPTDGRLLFESRTVALPADFAKLFAYLCELRKDIPRPVLETLDFSVHHIRKVGLTRYQQLRSTLEPLRHAAHYAFACYLLPSEAELKAGWHRE